MWRRRMRKVVEGAAGSVAPLLLHLIIVASVFDIYFKSPLVSVPEPEKPEVKDNRGLGGSRLAPLWTAGCRSPDFLPK